MAKQLTIELPDEISPEAERAIRELAIIALYHRGELSTREAADSLGLTYREYLDLLAERGIPQTCARLHPELIEMIIHQERTQT